MNRSIAEAEKCIKCGATYDWSRMVYHPDHHYNVGDNEHLELTCDRCGYREWFKPLDADEAKG